MTRPMTRQGAEDQNRDVPVTTTSSTTISRTTKGRKNPKRLCIMFKATRAFICSRVRSFFAPSLGPSAANHQKQGDPDLDPDLEIRRLGSRLDGKARMWERLFKNINLGSTLGSTPAHPSLGDALMDPKVDPNFFKMKF